MIRKSALVIALVAAIALPLAAGDGHAHGKSCSMKDKAKVVEMEGKILCRHCNLHETDQCEKVFQAANDETKFYPICSETEVDLETIGEHGTAKIKIKGLLGNCGEKGTEMLMIESAAKI
jgi:hypothetical protein